MRLVRSQPDRHFFNLEMHHYACDCGATNSVTVAHA
jgi:hypothetical protein